MKETVLNKGINEGSDVGALDLEALVAKYRMDLHQIPELGLDTPETAAYCKAALADTDFEIIEPGCAGSSFLAFLDAGKDHAIAFRTDMDGLPVCENTALEKKSLHEGNSHACGHDGHMAILLSFAHLCQAHLDELNSNIVLIFQSGEETSGGADLLCKSGFMDRYNVKAVFGQHLWPMSEKGTLSTRPLELMARTSEVELEIIGKSSHAARYKEGIDAMETGAKLLLALYDYEKSIPDDVYRLLRFGTFHAGLANNVVSDRALLRGTMRAFLDDQFEAIQKAIVDIANRIEQETGAKIEVRFSNGYPAVINDPDLTEKLMAAYPQIRRLDHPEMIAEDFSYYQKRVPGVFFFLGTGTGIALHNDAFDFDPAILTVPPKFYLSLVSASGQPTQS